MNEGFLATIELAKNALTEAQTRIVQLERERDEARARVAEFTADLLTVMAGEKAALAATRERSDIADIVAWLRKDDTRAAPYWTRTALADAIEKGNWKQK
jgi:hypothetical protein